MRLEFVITSDEMLLFQKLSGDLNPLHSDKSFARARGYVGPVVYGGLIVAQISRLLGNHMPGAGCVWQDLTLRFRAPLAVGQPAVLIAKVKHASAALNVQLISIKVRANDTPHHSLIAEGEVMAKLAVPASDRMAGRGVVIS